MYLGGLGAISTATTGIRTTPWPTVTSSVSSGRGLVTGLYDKFVEQGSGRGTVMVPGTPVIRDPSYSSFDLTKVVPFLQPNESALPGTPGTLRWRDSDYIYYKRALKPAKRTLYQRRLVLTGTREGGQEYHDSPISVYDGDPFSGGFVIDKKKIDGLFSLANVLGAVAMIAVGGAMILAAQAAQAAAAAGTAAASAGTTAGSASTVAATTGATAGGTAAGTSGITMSAATAASGGGAAAGGTAAAGTAAGGLTTGGVLKTATALYSAVKPIVSTASALKSAYDQVQGMKAAEKQAEQEAEMLLQYNREVEAQAQLQYAAQMRARATALQGFNVSTPLLLGAAGVLLVTLIAGRRKRK
jgi:hypothetical protein